MRRALWVVCAFFCLSAGASARAAVPVPTLAEVLKQLSGIEALTATFREEKRTPLLAAPLVSEGTLHYAKPRLLVRHIEKPRKSSVLLQGDTLTFGDKGASQSIALGSQPALRVLVETFVSVLAGDRAGLERVAEVTLEPRADGYRIRVVPKDANVKRLVQTMAFDGKGAELTRMEIIDASGDTSVTTFGRVTLRKPFSEAERARLFRVGN